MTATDWVVMGAINLWPDTFSRILFKVTSFNMLLLSFLYDWCNLNLFQLVDWFPCQYKNGWYYWLILWWCKLVAHITFCGFKTSFWCCNLIKTCIIRLGDIIISSSTLLRCRSFCPVLHPSNILVRLLCVLCFITYWVSIQYWVHLSHNFILKFDFWHSSLLNTCMEYIPLHLVFNCLTW